MNNSVQCQNNNQCVHRPMRIPTAEIYQDGDNTVIELDMPGVSKEDVQLQIRDNVLTLEGHLKEVPSTWTLLHKERSKRDYKRQFELSQEVDTDHITASMNAGVLTITLPRVPESKARKIEISC